MELLFGKAVPKAAAFFLGSVSANLHYNGVSFDCLPSLPCPRASPI